MIDCFRVEGAWGPGSLVSIPTTVERLSTNDWQGGHPERWARNRFSRVGGRSPSRYSEERSRTSTQSRSGFLKGRINQPSLNTFFYPPDDSKLTLLVEQQRVRPVRPSLCKRSCLTHGHPAESGESLEARPARRRRTRRIMPKCTPERLY